MTSATAKTSDMDLITVVLFLMCGPIMAIVYLFYAIGYGLKGLIGGNKIAMAFVGYPYLAFFMVLNTLHNWTVGTIIFREMPREFFTTSRCKRWKLSEEPSRRELADLIGGWLDARDPNHY